MTINKELTLELLDNRCGTNCFSFENTSELDPLEVIVGQERALKAMEFGLKIRIKGYNIYMSGPTGTGKTTYAQNCIKKVAEEERTPDDWCYINNFEKPNQPIAINLPAGTGRKFRSDLDKLIDTIKSKIPKIFVSEEYDRGKAERIREYQNKRSELLERLNNDAQKQGFKVKTSNTGVYFVPFIEGKEINEEEYEKLSEQEKKSIGERSRELQNETLEIIRHIKNQDRDAEKNIKEWEESLILSAISNDIGELKDKYGSFEKIIRFFEAIQRDILENLEDFKGDGNEGRDDLKKNLLIPFIGIQKSITDKYRANLLVDNSSIKGAPVICDFNPTYNNLIGRVEYENGFGMLTTNYKMIKDGLLHQANGGYLILQAKDVLSNYQSWEVLKRVLKTREIEMVDIREQLTAISVSTLKPEPIPANIKIILVGNEYIYQLLYEYDEDFKKLFKIKADFDSEMDRNSTNINSIARFIRDFCEREKAPHFERTAVARVVDYSSRMAGSKTKLTTRFNEIAEILAESVAWAKMEGYDDVLGDHVIKAIKEKIYRSNKYNEKIQEMLYKGIIMIDTSGSVIGQINGLSVLDTGDNTFGMPSKITAATYMGEKGIVNIEREIEMSGKSHSKGVLILGGYIGQKYVQEIPLSLTASVCFEQTYGGIDGDSASSAELYAILSSLSEAPLKQSIAVTGSVNQKGEIQPIGGATDKIEGFFELCSYRGLDGSNGVIIPWQNIENLMLKDEVIDAVKHGKFHIYAVKSIDEGIEILTGIPAGKRGAQGNYPKKTINYLVEQKLRKYASTSANFGKDENKT